MNTENNKYTELKMYVDRDENAGFCEDCGQQKELEEDSICHRCYHYSVPQGECWCDDNGPQKMNTEINEELKMYIDRDENAGYCEDCGQKKELEEDRICHRCYHYSVPQGECWCDDNGTCKYIKCEECRIN